MKRCLIVLVILVSAANAYSQNIGIGTTTPDSSSLLQIKSTTKGLLIPKMSTAQMSAIPNPAKGLLVFDTVNNVFMYNNGTAASTDWTPLVNTKFGWLTVGNDHIDDSSFLGTTVNKHLRFRTNNFERMVIDSTGKIGVGTLVPLTAKFHINSTGSGTNEALRLQGTLPLLSFYAGNNQHSQIWANGSYLDISTANGTNNGISFSPNSTMQMLVDYTGNVGIGTIPGAKLHVNQTMGNEVLRLQSNLPVLTFYAGNNLHSQFWANGSNLDISTGFGSGKGISFSPNASIKMIIDNNGDIGIGTTSTGSAKTRINTTSSLSYSQLLLTENSGTNFSRLRMNNGVNTARFWDIAGSIDASQGNDRLNFYNSAFGNIISINGTGNVGITNGGTFTMQRANNSTTVQINPEEFVGEGAQIGLYNRDNIMTIDIDADQGVNHKGRIILDEIQIQGGSDLAEHFEINKQGDEKPLPGMLVSIDEKQEGKLCITKMKNDKKIAGVISGANGIQPGMMMGQKGTIAYGDFPVALAGRVYVLSNEESGAIMPGDFITSSSVKGYAMKVKNIKDAQGAIIGKAMGKRDPTTGYVLVLISLQ